MKRLALLFVLFVVVALPAWAREKAQPRQEAASEQAFCPADDNAALAVEVGRALRPPFEGLRPVQTLDEGCATCDRLWDLAIWAGDPELSMIYAIKSSVCMVKYNCP